MSGLEGKAVLLTGGASGLGREVALRAAQRGARLALMDLHAERLEQTQADARGRGAEVITLRSDVSKEEDVVAAVRSVVERFGQLDVAVNCAAVFYGGPLVESGMADFDRCYDVNVRGLFMVCREAAKAMLPRQSGHIVNIGSIASTRGMVHETVYSSGKWAVLGLSECMNVELGPQGIKVTTVCPDGMNTTFWEHDPRDKSGWRMLDAGPVAQAIVDIVSLPEGVNVKQAHVFRPGS